MRCAQTPPCHLLQRLSQVESQLREAFPQMNVQGERDFAAIAAARQQHAIPILNQFKSWMDRELESGRVLPKSVIRKAFTYTLNQWSALCRYTKEGYLSFENNAAERLVKNPAIGRKNYLFVGGERGGRDAAVFYSLVSSSKANGVEPFAWLKDIFKKLPYHRGSEAFAQSAAGDPVTSDELDKLLPDRWIKSHPQHAWTKSAAKSVKPKKKLAEETAKNGSSAIFVGQCRFHNENASLRLSNKGNVFVVLRIQHRCAKNLASKRWLAPTKAKTPKNWRF